ncbi:MAG: preprotein translocase subunit SecY [Nanoarchaeota archaeon]|nr:preprotein translocase subunit SecY [Nanoarchaeota archaeon]
MGIFDNFILNLPEVESPKQKKQPFNDRLKWTLSVLILFFIMGLVPLWPLGPSTLQQFQYLSIILGAEFGSLISLGIGPIVTGSIILQLLQGAGMLKLDLSTHEGKRRYQGIQKLMSILFVIFEAAIYVFMGGISTPDKIGSTAVVGVVKTQLQLLLVFELFLGGMIVLFMDEIVSKWGFGSGISLFIAAGISKAIFLQLFSFMDQNRFFPWEAGFNWEQIIGHIGRIIVSLLNANYVEVGLSLVTIAATVVVFLLAVYAQAMKVEIPLSFGRIRGHGIRWPLQFIYTSNIPVILVASLFATLQLWVRLLQNWMGGKLIPILGGYEGANAVGLVSVLNGPNLVNALLTNGGDWGQVVPVLGQSLVYILLMVGGSVLFSLFWVQTSGLDAESLAKQIMSSGLQVPGFRQDKRILERMLNRYILPLTVMGAITVGALAAFADLMGALSRGTGILLTVMIIYKLYEDIAREHMLDMNPMMKKFMGK